MTEKEIVKSYKNAVNQRAQIGILAELNLCSKKEITAIIEAAGLNVPGRRPVTKKEPIQEAVEEKKEELPEAVSKLIIARIEELDRIIGEYTREYEELAKFLGIGA